MSRQLLCEKLGDWSATHPGQYAQIRGTELIAFLGWEQAWQFHDATDSAWLFYLGSRREELKQLAGVGHSFWACVCEPYLDTEDPSGVARCNRILNLRGLPNGGITLMRIFALPAFLINCLTWDWASLGLGDILMGYSALFWQGALLLSLFCVAFFFFNIQIFDVVSMSWIAVKLFIVAAVITSFVSGVDMQFSNSVNKLGLYKRMILTFVSPILSMSFAVFLLPIMLMMMLKISRIFPKLLNKIKPSPSRFA